MASKYPEPPSTGNSEVVSRDWMRENMKDLDAPWEPEEPSTPDPEKQPGFWLFTQDKRNRRLSKIHVRQTCVGHLLGPRGPRVMFCKRDQCDLC